MYVVIRKQRQQKRLRDVLEMEDVVKPINTENDMETGTKLQLINIKDLERQKELGSGHFGVVYKGIYKTKHNDEPINIPVAIKILKKSSYIDNNELMKEAVLLAVCNHRNLVKFIGICIAEGQYQIVLALEGRNLESYLKEMHGKIVRQMQSNNNNSNRLNSGSYERNSSSEQIRKQDSVMSKQSQSFNQQKYPLKSQFSTSSNVNHWLDLRVKLLSYCHQITSGMCYLTYEKRMIHRDLALRNVLMSKNSDLVKITDFGLAKMKPKDTSAQTKQENMGGILPVKWLAPESIEFAPARIEFTHASDVWSFGITCWEILTLGGKPWHDVHNFKEIIRLIKLGCRLKQPEIVSIEVYATLIECWNYHPDKRPDFKNLYQTFEDYAKDPNRFISREFKPTIFKTRKDTADSMDSDWSDNKNNQFLEKNHPKPSQSLMNKINQKNNTSSPNRDSNQVTEYPLIPDYVPVSESNNQNTNYQNNQNNNNQLNIVNSNSKNSNKDNAPRYELMVQKHGHRDHLNQNVLKSNSQISELTQRTNESVSPFIRTFNSQNNDNYNNRNDEEIIGNIINLNNNHHHHQNFSSTSFTNNRIESQPNYEEIIDPNARNFINQNSSKNVANVADESNNTDLLDKNYAENEYIQCSSSFPNKNSQNEKEDHHKYHQISNSEGENVPFLADEDGKFNENADQTKDFYELMEEKEEQEKKEQQQQLTMTRATASESTTDRDSTYLYEQVGENEENTIENNDNVTNNNNYKDRNRTQESDYQNYIFESQASDNIFGESTSNQAMYQNVYNDDKDEEEESSLQ